MLDKISVILPILTNQTRKDYYSDMKAIAKRRLKTEPKESRRQTHDTFLHGLVFLYTML